jgi:NAD(P) transhydrogenase subunit beta
MSLFDTVIRLTYLASAVCFVLGLHLMNSPVTARRGNAISAAGMIAAVAATAVLVVRSGTVTPAGWLVLAAGTATGALAGWYAARTVAMTSMPQLVSLFNAVGGGAAALVAVHDFVRRGAGVTTGTAVAVVLDVSIGGLTFAGSLVASGKLQGMVPGRPLVFRGVRVLNAALCLVILAGGGSLVAGRASVPVLMGVIVAALALGVTAVLPIGGADAPVVISLLNACTGIAVAMAGFVIGNTALVIAGALVGASGAILTKLMADAMNRSIPNIVAGGFGTGDAPAPDGGGAGGARVRAVSADDAAIQLA